MMNNRKSGILCHITSIPNEFRVGDFGQCAYDFVNFLEHTDQSFWQILPLTHAGSSFSPYQSLSLFALNPILISLSDLYKEGYISEDAMKSISLNNNRKIDFFYVYSEKMNVLNMAAEKFISFGHNRDNDYCQFKKENEWWLEDYSLFMSLRDRFNGKPWNEWDKPLADREPLAIKEAKENLKTECEKYSVIQFWLNVQWLKVKKFANEKGIRIIGDMPMYPDFDSDIVWAKKEYFLIDSKNNPSFIAGVPPDYFCEDGQYWGNPFYDWDYIKKDNFEFWKTRFEESFKYCDIVRVDHFRAFSEAWKIPYNSERSAKGGKWVTVPGRKILDIIKEKYPDMPIIAEDLGDIDHKVRELRDHYRLPGMSILQFAFDSPDSLYLPHNQIKNQVYYTGTHDNNTVQGWWKECDESKKDYVRKYLNIDGNDISWQLIQTAFMSSCNTVIIPIQDILNLDEKYRMNVPGVVSEENWAFRFSWDMFHDRYVNRLKEITNLYCRNK